MHFPCVRIQENFKDKADIIRMGMQKIRVSNIWYGDYRAQVGACRTGERRLKELVAQYGAATIKAFIEAWMDYGERRAIAAIRQLPAGSFTYEVRHDPVPGVCDEGIPIKATVTIDPEAGADHRRRARQSGLRARRAQSLRGLRRRPPAASASSTTSTPSMPHNHGSAEPHRPAAARRLRRRPAAASDRHLLRHQQLHGAPGQCGAMLLRRRSASPMAWPRAAAISPPRWASSPASTTAALGAGGLYHPAHDGALRRARPSRAMTAGSPMNRTAGNGMMVSDSIEVDEAMYPILFEERRIATDSMGAGEWCGAPATGGSYRSLTGDITHLLLRRWRHLPGQGRARRRAGAHLRQLEAPSRRQARAPARFPHGEIRRGRGGRLPLLRRRRLWRSPDARSRSGSRPTSTGAG